MLTRDRLVVTGSTGEAPVITDGKGGGAAAAAPRALANTRCTRSLWVSGRLVRGLGKVLGGLAGSGEARASELHGGGAMADDGKGEKPCGCSGVSFIGGMAWRRVQARPGMDRLARAAVGYRQPRRLWRRRTAALHVVARQLARVGARWPSLRGRRHEQLKCSSRFAGRW
jgi:hypothetical protein